MLCSHVSRPRASCRSRTHRSSPAMTVTRLDHVQLAMPAGGEDAVARGFYAGAARLQGGYRSRPELAGRGGAWFRSGTAVVHLGVESGLQRPRARRTRRSAARDLDALIDLLAEASGAPDRSRRRCSSKRRRRCLYRRPVRRSHRAHRGRLASPADTRRGGPAARTLTHRMTSTTARRDRELRGVRCGAESSPHRMRSTVDCYPTTIAPPVTP